MTTIIKVGESNSSDSEAQATAFRLDDMSQLADGYLQEARLKARQILAEANQQADRIRQQAEQQGQHAAVEAVANLVRNKVSQQIQTTLPALQQMVKEIRCTKDKWLSQWEREAVRLATAIAARVIRRELSQDPRITLDLVSESLRLASTSGTLKILLNPEDHATLLGEVETIAKELRELAPTQILPHSSISPGGCRVETDNGSVDQQIEIQLKRIEEELNNS